MVLPSPLTEEVKTKVLACFVVFLFLNKNWILDLRALNDSATVDFGLSKTARLLTPVLFPIAPRIGIL